LAQLPQLALSRVVSTHSPAQRVSPETQVVAHWPAEQACPLVQTLAQLPQFALSLEVSTHRPEQSVSPETHEVAHWPAEHA
jgi:hypothetical protein